MADTAPDPAKDRGARRDHGPGGNGKDKPPMGLLDVTKDVAVSDNNILSPQWLLHPKPSEGKTGLPVAPGNTRPLSSSSQGALVESTPRDAWRLEGSQDKKEWRRNGSDVESSRRWREEERETGSLGKREYRKGERENEYRKNDRRSDNASMRESTDSRTALSSERRHEGASRTSGNESRRDSKWSSRWGPEDKEKDPRVERKNDGEKEASHSEKQPIIGSTDKWRSLRNRQETHSGGSAVYRGAPGFGTDRGRVEGANVGFGRGRSRSSSGPGLPISRTSSSASIGAATSMKTESLHEKSNLSGDAFRYPRGKLLDKCRMIKMQLDATPEGFVEAHQITLSSAILPLAFEKPDSEEVDALRDILKGKVTSSEACYDSSWERIEIATDSETGTNIANQISKNEVSALSNELDSGMTSAVSKDDQNCSKELSYSEKKADQAKVKIDDEYAGLPESLMPDNPRGIYSTTSLDSCTKVPDDASCDATFTHGTVGSIETELTEVGAPAILSLFYMDPQGDIQGPFLPEDILTWHAQGFFGTDLPVRLSDAPENAHFRPLGDVLPELGWKPQFAPLIDSGLQSHQADTTRGNLEAVAPASEFSKFTNTGSKDPFLAPLSNSETFDGIPGTGNHNFNDFSGQDSEEVLYMGRSVSSTQKPFETLANETHGLPRAQSAQQFLASERGQAVSVNQKVPTGNDVNPFGLSWSELKGTHQAPLSSNLAGVGDRGHIISHYAGEDASRLTGFLPETNRFNLDEHLLSQQRQNHELQHQLNPLVGGDASRIRHKDPFGGETNRFNLEEHLMSQQFQNEELQPQHLPSVHQNMHMGGAYLEQLQGPSHHHQSFNQAIDMERLLKLQLQQQRHLQQLEQEQHLHQQEQHIRYRMQLLQEQHQRQQHQLLLEQLLHQQQHDPTLGFPHAESVRGEAIDLYRQHLLHELQQKSRHLPVDRDASLDRIQSKFGHNIHQQYNAVLGDLIHPRHRHMHSLEQQHLLGLQQEQLQSRQFPTAPSQQPGIGDERHADGVWSIDESGQFVRAAAIPHQTRSGKLGQSDFVQALEPSSYYDRMMRENYGLNSQHIDRSTSTPRPNVDVLENHGHMNSASQMGHFPFSNRPQQNMVPNQFTSAVERNLSGPIGQLSSNFTELQNSQFHLAAEQQKRDMHAQPLGLVGRASMPSSYMNREPSWPFPATNNSLNAAGQKMALGDSFSEAAFFTNLGQTSQEHLTDLNFERQVDTLESSGRLPLRTSSGVSAEYKKFFLDTRGNGQLADYTGGEMGVLGAPEGGGVKQAESSAIDHGSLNVNGPVRHASFGGAGGGTNLFNYDRGVDNALDGMTTDRIPGVFARGSESLLLMRANDQHTSSSKGALTEPVAVPLVKANSSTSFAYSEGTGWDHEGNLADAVSNTTSLSRKDARFQRASSYSDADASETSFIDMLKGGTRRQMPETDSSAGASEPADAGQGRGSSKKKGKKGRQIDPALLGFKVHSNRILMGEIQRPDD